MNLNSIPDKYILLIVFAAAAAIYLITKDPIFAELTKTLAIALIAVATGRGIGTVTTTNISTNADKD